MEQVDYICQDCIYLMPDMLGMWRCPKHNCAANEFNRACEDLKLKEGYSMSIISKIHTVSMTEDTVTFNKSDFNKAKNELWDLIEKERNNPNVSDRVKLRWEGMYNVLFEICCKWGEITF